MTQPKEISTECLGGLNQTRELATFDQCRDAQNVWAPNGTIERRPGFIYDSIGTLGLNATIVADGAAMEIGGVFTLPVAGVLDLSNFPAWTVANDAHWYLGFSTLPVTGKSALALNLVPTAVNSNQSLVRSIEYWNGLFWCPIRNMKESGFTGLGTPYPYWVYPYAIHLGATGYLPFAIPGDFSASTPAAGMPNAYYFRFSIEGAALDAATTVTVANCLIGYSTPVTTPVLKLRGLSFCNLFPSPTRKLSILLNSINKYHVVANYAEGGFTGYYTAYPPALYDFTASFASIPEAGEAFVSYGGTTYRMPAVPSATDPGAPATVEDRPFAVGPGTDYDPASIIQDATWPVGKFMCYAAKRLWSVDDNNVKWSAASPYHRVWPSLATEPLTGDNTPTTGIFPFGDSVAVSKSNAIYQGVFTTLDGFGVPHYSFRRTVAGQGFVAFGSVQNVNGALVGLGNSFLMEYNGSSYRNLNLDTKGRSPTNADRLAELFRSIATGARQFAASCVWKEKNAYILSIPTNGSDVNDTTLVWDYARDVFWIWRGFVAQAWAVNEDSSGKSTCYFGDQYGHIFEFGIAPDDYGAAIDAWIETEPLGLHNKNMFELRELSIWGTNMTGDEQVTMQLNDSTKGVANTWNFDDYHESKFGTALNGVNEWVVTKHRKRYNSIRKVAKFVTVKVRKMLKGGDFHMSKISLEVLPTSRRS